MAAEGARGVKAMGSEASAVELKREKRLGAFAPIRTRPLPAPITAQPAGVAKGSLVAYSTKR